MTVALYILCGFLGGVFADHWKPALLFKKPPPTVAVSELQAQAKQAEAAKDAAVKAVSDAKDADKSGLVAQVKAAQRDSFAAEIPLSKTVNPSPEVILGLRMVNRANIKLAVAVGRLSAEEQGDLVELIDQALSDKQAEVDIANAKLAKADADFKAITAQRDAVAAEIPKLQQKAADAAKQTASVQQAYDAKVNEVNAWAAKTDAEQRKNGSLLGSIDSLWHWFLGIAGAVVVLYLLVHVALPCWAQSYPSSTVLAKLSAAAKNLTTAHS